MLLICKSTKSELIYIYCRRSVNGNKRSCIKIRILTKTLAPGRGNLGGGGRLRERRDGGAGRGGGSWGERCSGTHSFRFFKRGFLNERFHYKEDGTSHILHLSDGRYKFVLFSMLQVLQTELVSKTHETERYYRTKSKILFVNMLTLHSQQK